MRELLDDSDELTLSASTPLKPGKSTGPRTTAGKAKSSMNRLDHGCRSQKTILRDEDPAEYEAVVQAWLDIYQPQDRKEDELVHEIIKAHWQLKRCRKRLEEVEYELPGNAWNWTGEHQKLYANFSRYKTTAERSFRSAYKEMEALRGRQLREEQMRDKALVAFAEVDLKWLNKQQAEASSKQLFEQVVEVDVDEQGNCLTDCYPTNDEILQAMNKKPYTPVLMQRTIIFLKDVPPEYSWTHPQKSADSENLIAQQKMSWDRWRELIQIEKACRNGHLGPLYSPPAK